MKTFIMEGGVQVWLLLHQAVEHLFPVMDGSVTPMWAIGTNNPDKLSDNSLSDNGFLFKRQIMLIVSLELDLRGLKQDLSSLQLRT